MTVKKYIYLVIAFVLVLRAVSAYADEEGEVIINGTVLMRFAAGNGIDIKAKSDAVTERLEEKVREGASVKGIVVKPIKGGAAIYWQGTVMCTIDGFQAKANKTTPVALARLWASNIVSLLGEKPLRLSKDNLSLPVGEEGRISVMGGKGELKVSYDASVVEVTTGDDLLIIRGKAAGTARIVVQRGSMKGIIRAVIKDWAGKIMPPLVREVTGNPVPPDIQSQAALNALGDAVQVQPGAQLYLRENPKITIPLEKGAERIVSIPIEIGGKGYYPVEGTVKIQLKNIDLPLDEPSSLMISNRPEELKDDGILFQGRFSKKAPVRLFYSHKNGSSEKRKLWITLKNLSRTPSKLLLSRAYAGPDKYEVMAGHKAAMRFLEYRGARAGYMLDIHGRATIVLDEFEMASNFTLSGICDMQIMEGEEMEVEVKTTTGSSSSLKILQEPFDPFKIHPYGIFPCPQIEVQKDFVIPGDSLPMEVGEMALAH